MEQLPDRNSVSYPHVLIWPLAALGHVNPMPKRVELLCHAGVKITFLNTEEFHERLIRHSSDVFSRCMNLPGFQFKTITDGLPLNHPRISDKLHEYWSSLALVTSRLMKEMLIDSKSPVNCMITDGFMSFEIDVAREVGIPIFYFRTISACAFWAYYCIPEIIDAGALPIRGKDGENQIPEELDKATKERGYIAGGVSQEEVLAHKAIGAFFTDSGWNSTLKSIVKGAPMICWPSLVDQLVNCRCVGEIWKLGLDTKDLCHRKIVEKLKNDLLEVRREEFMKSADRKANLACISVNEGGSSYSNLDHLINDEKMMRTKP